MRTMSDPVSHIRAESGRQLLRENKIKAKCEPFHVTVVLIERGEYRLEMGLPVWK